ncbi:hypothetical protein, partial [Plesiomonas shigelloides]
MQDSTILESQLDLISNKSILWTEYGLRSLSRSRCELTTFIIYLFISV